MFDPIGLSPTTPQLEELVTRLTIGQVALLNLVKRLGITESEFQAALLQATEAFDRRYAEEMTALTPHPPESV